MAESRHLDARALRGLARVGDVLVPGGDDLPSFSGSGLVRHVDRALDYLSPADREGFRGLCAALAFVPRPLIRMLFCLAAHSHRWPVPIGAALRLVDLGLKGVIYGVYYSEPDIRRRIGWDAHVTREDK